MASRLLTESKNLQYTNQNIMSRLGISFKTVNVCLHFNMGMAHYATLIHTELLNNFHLNGNSRIFLQIFSN